MTMPATGLREVARHAVRDEVLRQAWILFGRQGFEATTVEQVADAAGMSRRTFFRYFEGKDELILAKLLEAGERVAAELAARPADEPAWSALRASFTPLVTTQEANAEAARRMHQLLEAEPAARHSMEERRRRWLELLTPLVGDRIPGASPVRAAAVAGASLACLEAAQRQWVEQPRTRLATLVDEAMKAVAEI